MLAEYDFIAGPPEQFNLDQRDGYVAARKRLIGFLNKRKVRNPITIPDDIHSSWVHDLKTDFSDASSETVGTEFVGTSITSSFPGAFLGPVEVALVDNPHTRYFDGSYRDYVRCDVDRERLVTTFKGVPTEPGQGSVVEPEAPSYVAAAFAVENGQPGTVQEGPTTTQSTYQGESEPFDPSKLD